MWSAALGEAGPQGPACIEIPTDVLTEPGAGHVDTAGNRRGVVAVQADAGTWLDPGPLGCPGWACASRSRRR